MGFFELLEHMEKRRTSLNGIFGMHTHFHQLATAFQSQKPTSQWKQFLNRFEYFINIRRRDRLAQAASFAIAFKSNAWTSEAPAHTLAADEFSDALLIKSLNFVSMSDLAMQSLIKDFSITCKTIWYEDFVENPDQTIRDTLSYIGTTPNALASGAAPIAKQGTELNEVLKSRLVN
jgi:LPS sulfotransferase NodH